MSKINCFSLSIHNKVNKKHVHNNIWDVMYMIISSSKSDMDTEYTVSLVITMIITITITQVQQQILKFF